MTELKIAGEVECPLSFTAESLGALPAESRTADVRTLGSSRSGAAASLAALLALARPRAGARYITFGAPADGFHVSVALDLVAAHAWVVYEIDGKPVERSKGGPFRLIIPDPAACGHGELDECVNVKFLEEIVLSAERGPDSRPADERAHAALHENDGKV